MNTFILLQLSILIPSSYMHFESNVSVMPVVEQQISANCYYVDCFIDNLVAQGHFTRKYLNYFFSNVRVQDKIITLIDKPATSISWYKFSPNHINDKKISQGVKFYLDNKKVLNDVYETYKVPPEIIVATLGIETNYGTYTGNFNVANALYTLAFYYPRKYQYFQQELIEYLLMVEKYHLNPYDLQGSYAGAMGYPQFMPSSFNKYAKSYDNLEFPDIWNKIEDAIVSIANYYYNQGWVDSDLVMVEVNLTPNEILEDIIKRDTNLELTVKDLKKLGVFPLQNINDDELAFLFKLEVAPDIYKYYIGLNNFYVIWKYNHSRNYASVVYTLSNQIKSKLLTYKD